MPNAAGPRSLQNRSGWLSMLRLGLLTEAGARVQSLLCLSSWERERMGTQRPVREAAAEHLSLSLKVPTWPVCDNRQNNHTSRGGPAGWRENFTPDRDRPKQLVLAALDVVVERDVKTRPNVRNREGVRRLPCLPHRLGRVLADLCGARQSRGHQLPSSSRPPMPNPCAPHDACPRQTMADDGTVAAAAR